MKKDTSKSELDAILRKKAAELLKYNSLSQDYNLSGPEIIKLINELDIQQIELEMQNNELKRANESEKNAGAKYTNLYNFAPAGYYILSDSGEIVGLNILGTNFLGKERSLLMNHKFEFFVPDDEKPIFRFFLRKVFASETKESCEIKLFINTTIIYIHLTGIANENKKQCLLTAIDVTENKKNQVKIKSSEEKYQTIFENDRDSITIFRINDNGKPGNFIEANEATTEIFGYSKKELLSLSVYDLEKVPKKIRNERLKTLKLQGRIDFETCIKTKKGKYREVEVQVVLINFLNEPAIMNITRDITERKQMENNIKKAYENLATILEAIPDLLFEVGLDCRIYHYQSHSDELLAVPPNMFMGKLLQEVLPAEAVNVFLEAINEANKKNWSIGKQYSLELPNGKFWFELSVSPINNGNDKDKNKHFIALARNVTNRKLAEIALKDSENFLKQTQVIANLGSYSLEIETGKWTSSEVLDSIFGIDSNYDNTYELWTSIIHPEWRQKMTNYFTQEVIGLKKLFDKEYKIIRLNDKEERWVHGQGELIYNAKNDLIRMIGTIQDITERKKSEERLRQLSQAVEQSPSTIMITNVLGNIEYVNPKFEQTTGYTFEEVQGKNPRILNSGHTKSDEYKNLWNAVKEGKEWRGEFYNKRKDGTFYWESASISPIINEKEEITHYIAIKEDITERKKRENELIIANKELLFQSEEKEKRANELSIANLELAFKNKEKRILTKNLTEAQTLAKIGSWQTDLHTFNAIWSQEMYRIFELNPDDFQATHQAFLNSIHPEDYEKVNAAFLESLNKNMYNKLEHRIITPSGNIKFVEENWHIIYDEQGKPIKAIGTTQDISHAKLTELELRKAKDRAEESDRLKSAFLANMSHEIRTPMNGILGFTKLLKEPKLSGKDQQEYIKIIEKSGNRMLNIINDIISISKVESGQMEVALSDTNVNEQVKYLYTFFKHEANLRGLELFYTTTLKNKETNIKTDKEKLYAILTNLVKNAIKFTEVGSIAFGYEKKGDFLEFYVKDTGNGIPENQKKLIFERFRQAHESVSRNFEGSGLGLTISKAYVELLGGKIWVESEEGKGSTFYFTIPFIPADKEVEEEDFVIDTTTDKPDARVRKLKVLIVEDDAISKLLITIAIKKFAGEILNANTGLEAIEACRNNPDIDLVMMDINMPEMDGYEATSRIRKFNKNVVIIAQTANAFARDRDEAIAAGCSDYIPKPVNLANLKSLIEKYF